MTEPKYNEAFWMNFAETYAAARGVQIAAIFNPPASEDAILTAECHVGFRLPGEVRAAFRCFDGQSRLKRVGDQEDRSDSYIFPMINYCHSLSEAIIRWDMYRSMEPDVAAYSWYDADNKFRNTVWPDRGEYEIMPVTWGPATHWPVPFDRMRFPLGLVGHVAIWVDMNPRPEGKAGQIIRSVITDEAYWEAPSYGAHCERLLELIESERISWKGRWKYASTGREIRNIFLDDEVRQLGATMLTVDPKIK